MNHAGHGKIRRFALWCMICCMAFGLAAGETAVRMEADEWTWEAGGLAFFHGSVQADQAVEDAELSLTVETSLADSGEAIFTVLNGKMLTLRKRGPTGTLSLAAGEAADFEGQWELPEEADAGIAHAVIRLTVKDSAGQEIASGALEVGSAAEESALTTASPVYRADRLILWLGIASAVVWVLAILRHILLNRRKGKE